ncbi:ABC-2 type transport system permease protein [Paenibacillus rhizosphaerae]|uniref:ABC-2 type transport system permease protein n=1 Tax=Paenibacillus rhizosphaerae TaxID=297318 RepID=A0A839TS69_9BACL|nr:ABC transporter permease [Paenibacillus rhizosphaerae]MBB3129572.1 ABC-2 type transport system permease protein [Paenibacillus rhizosphaerae]
MSNVIRAEWFKLRKDLSFRTLFLCIAAAAIVYPLLIIMDHTAGEPEITSLAFMQNVLAGNAYVLKFSAALLAGFFISSEYSTGVMKCIASSGNSRIRLFIAKLLVFTVGAVMLALVLPVVSTAVMVIASGDAGSLPLPFVLRALGFTVLYAAGFAGIAALFSTLLTDSGKSIGFLFILFLLADSLFAGAGGYIPFIGTLYDYSVFKLVNNVPILERSSGQLTAMTVVPVVWFLMFGALGILAFRKKEIK